MTATNPSRMASVVPPRMATLVPQRTPRIPAAVARLVWDHCTHPPTEIALRFGVPLEIVALVLSATKTG